MTNRRVQRGAMLEMVTEAVRLPSGETATLDLIHHPGASAVVPFLSAEEVLLIRQYRHAVGGTILEVPAGKLDPGEDPADCAVRELEEETGYRAAHCEPLCTIWTTPGFTDERIHLFAAYELAPGRQALEADEIIELVPMRLDEAIARVFDGEISDAKSALALLHAGHRADRSG